MRIALQWVLARIYDGVVAAGYEDLSRAQVGMIRYPSVDGLRPSEIADRLQVTKQSVNDLLGEMEGRGYLVRQPDPRDGRARVVRLTRKGQQLEEVIHEAAGEAEAVIAELLGPRRFAEFRGALVDVADQIAGGTLPLRHADETDPSQFRTPTSPPVYGR